MNLKPVDFKAVAAKGCYVYCYLREDGTPYYVGVATSPYRPFQEHSCPSPRYDALIRVMRSGCANWAEAAKWEMFYIARYGRKNNGTGILRNLTDGGEGVKGLVFTENHRAKMAASNKAYWSKNLGALKLRNNAISNSKFGHIVCEKTKLKIAATLANQDAAKSVGLTVDEYLALDSATRQRINYQIKNGLNPQVSNTTRRQKGADSLGITLSTYNALHTLLGAAKHIKRTVERARAYGFEPVQWAMKTRDEKISIAKLA